MIVVAAGKSRQGIPEDAPLGQASVFRIVGTAASPVHTALGAI
jgi:hypothetical protein